MFCFVTAGVQQVGKSGWQLRINNEFHSARDKDRMIRFRSCKLKARVNVLGLQIRKILKNLGTRNVGRQ